VTIINGVIGLTRGHELICRQAIEVATINGVIFASLSLFPPEGVVLGF
jgi:hypothetical protein